ncbi:MAG TPA: glycogen/starch synthase [Dissulfurispiraceae bacterium]|nr:glycogen/starch synthase [Dissulfurispiraceae bacterium]
MRIVIASPEAVPFSKTGGLADVAGTLFREYRKAGLDAFLMVPLYKSTREAVGDRLRDTGVTLDIPAGPVTRRCGVYTLRTEKYGSGPSVEGNIGGGRVFFVENEDLFGREELYGTALGDYPDNAERFIVFSRGVLEICRTLRLSPHIIHCNDWQTGLIPYYLKTAYHGDGAFRKAKTVMTIHNLGYQGLFPPSVMDVAGLGRDHFHPGAVEFYGNVNFLKAGIIAADAVTTVSPTYAREILTPEFGFGLDGVLRKRSGDLTGILNGIDDSEWNPLTDAHLPASFSSRDLSGREACRQELRASTGLGDSEGPLLCFIGRLSSQKGIELLIDVMPALMRAGAQFVVLGKGEDIYQRRLADLSGKFPGAMHMSLGFNEPLAHLCYAGSDIFLMPSRYEPCGLGQLIAMRYGSIPVATMTGGLSDTISDVSGQAEILFCDELLEDVKGTGFLVREYAPEALLGTVKKAICVFRKARPSWRKIVLNAMDQDFSWSRSARLYGDLYQRLAGA